MEPEHFVFGLSLLLQILGGLSVVLSSISRRTRLAIHAEIFMIACLCGLGSVTLIGAVLRLACGLVSGIAVVFIGLAVIYLADHPAEDNPMTPYVKTSYLD